MKRPIEELIIEYFKFINPNPIYEVSLRFSENRKQHLLGTVDPKQFPHFYMFAVNTEVLRSHRIELGERLSF